MPSKIAGVSFSNEDGTSRQKLINAHCRPGMPLGLQREPNNTYDRNAVSVWIWARSFLFFSKAFQIGYLNSDIAQEIATHMDRGGRAAGVITAVTGGTRDKPTRGVNIELTVDQ